ncbi:MAG: hypothetical protein ABI353_00660 [Isosphaeraceae bacterium]
MTLPEMADALTERRINLSLRLVIDAPAGSIDADLRQALDEHKAALLVHLANEDRWNVLKDQRWGGAPGTEATDAEYERLERLAIQGDAG